MARLSLRLLGTFQATLDRTPLAGFESDKERALLAFLAEERRQPHRREKLAGLLWPEQTEAAARNNLRRTLSNLRRLLGDRDQAGNPFLLVTHQTIRFNSAGDAWIDSLALANLLSPPGQQATAQIEAAVRLYRGSFLEGFSLASSPDFEEWIVLCRERYARLMCEALHHLVADYEIQGRYEHALRPAWRLVNLEPWWEEAHRQLIRLLALSGRRNDALAQYLRLRSLLAEELDVAPSEETTALYKQIRDGALTPCSLIPQHPTGLTHNLPIAPGPFVGREAEVARIQDYLRDPSCRLLTLVGAGGMGKTRLALEAAVDWLAQPQETGLERAALVPLASVQTEEGMVAAIAQSAGLSLSPGHEPWEQLIGGLVQKKWLLILDGLEHLPGGAQLVAEILRTAATVKILVTSRARLNVHGEHCFPVVGIAYPERVPKAAQDARSFAAVELFLQSARQVHPIFEPAEADLVDIARICRHVQGMPLAILLAAAWMDALAPAEIAKEISKGLDFLEANWPDVPERHRSLGAVFGQSWQQLTAREQEVFQALSVFAGGFDGQAAQRVAESSLRDLKALVDKSLLQYTPSGRYEIHELLRQYTADKLDLRPDLHAAIRDRHCAYYCTALARWKAEPGDFRQQAALVEMEVEAENIRAAWYWAVQQVHIERLDQAIEGLVHFYWQSGRFQEAEAALAAAATAAMAAAAGVGDRAVCLHFSVRALAWKTDFQRAMGQTEAASRVQQECLRILEDPALAKVDMRLERAILSWIMGATVCMADYALGRQRFQESYSLFHDIECPWGMAWALNAWSSMAMFLGDYREAKLRLEEGMSIHRSMGNQSGIAASLSRLAAIASMEGRFDEAKCLAGEGVVSAREGGSRTEQAFGLLVLGGALEKAAKFTQAYEVSQQCLDLYTDLGHHEYITEAQGLLGSITLHLGRYGEARDRAQTSLRLARTDGPQYCVGHSLGLLGCLALAEGDMRTACRSVESGVAAYREMGGHYDHLSWSLAVLGLVRQSMGDLAGARDKLRQALALAAELGAVPPLLWALPVAALHYASRDRIELARELYALALRYPFVAESCWFTDVTGKPLAACGVAVADGQIPALKDGGGTCLLQATVAQLIEEL